MRTRNRNRHEDTDRALAAAKQHIVTLEAKLERLTGRDPITGLPELKLFRARLDVERTRAQRYGRPLSVAVVDIDGFRALNAHHGYVRGDEALAAVGRVIANFTRVHDQTCRASGDEFLALMPETDGAGAMLCFERILLELEGIELGELRCLSASVGIATLQAKQTADELLATASAALHRARGAGGGRAVAIADGQPTDTPEEAVQRDVIAVLAGAMLERDRYTGEHSQSVVAMAASVARSLGLDSREIENVRSAALLHDIGKIGVPDDILHKNGPLTDAEWERMRDHTIIGERILRAIPGMGGVARIVRHEHERWDGGGYPDGLSGSEIPIGSRIILACDAYHAMTTDRPYREALSHGQAIDELVKSASTQFDPEVTEALCGHLYWERR